MIYAICLVLALVLLLILASLFGKRFWRRGSSFYLSPRFSLPQDSALSRRERTICRYYTESLRPLTELTFGKRKSQPLHTMYMHVRLCDAQSQSYQVDDVVSLYQAIDAASGPIFVIGEPGSGKSILARYLVNRVLTPNDIRLDPGLQSIGKRQADQWIPLFVDPSLAQDYASHSMDSSQPEERFKKWLAGVTFLRSTHPIVSMLFNPMDREKAAVEILEKILESGRALIILDGLEHAIGERASEVEDEAFIQGLKAFAQRYCKPANPKMNLLLVTARPGEASDFYNWSCFELLPLTDTFQRKLAFLQKLIDDEKKANEIANAVVSNARISRVTGNPLLLSIFAELLENKPLEQVQMPFTRVRLYQAYIEERWQHFSGQKPLSLEQAKNILGQLAYKMCRDKRLAVPGSELETSIERVLNDASVEIAKVRWELIDHAEYLYPIDPMTLQRKSRLWYALLGLSSRMAQWRPTDPLRIQLSFLHFTFQEFFAYFYWLADDRGTREIETVCAGLDVPWQQEIMAMYLSQHPQAPGIIDQCIRSRKDILKRALERNYHSKLHRLLDAHFDREELRTLCFDLGVEYDNLQAEGKGNKARELVIHLDKQGRVDELVDNVSQMRPDAVWEKLETSGHAPIGLRTLFLLARILYEYKIKFYDDLEMDIAASETYDEIRSEVIDGILDQLETASLGEWTSISMTDGLAAGELLTRDDWQRISDFMSPGQPIDRRVTAVVLCGKVGGEQAVTVLLQRLDDTERVAKEAVGSLQALVDQAAEQVLETIREPQSPLQQSRAFEVISASDSPKTLSSLLSLVLNSEDDSMRSDAQDAIFKIAYDEHADAIHPELFKYLLDPDRPEYEFVSELLVIVGDQAIGNLCGRLCDPTQTKLHAPILGILSSMGLQLARSSTRDQQRFEEMLKTLLGSTKSNEVKFALQILGCAEPDWAVRALANLCLVLTVPQRLRVVGYLKDLPSQAPADCEDVGIFVGQALEYLAEDPSRRVRRAARRVIDRL